MPNPTSSSSLGERELSLLERLSAILGSLDQPAEVLDRLMDLFLAAMEAERGLLLEFGPAGQAEPRVIGGPYELFWIPMATARLIPLTMAMPVIHGTRRRVHLLRHGFIPIRVTILIAV